MAEIHLIGELVGATDFPTFDSLFCKWSIHFGGAWKHLQGLKDGQTQVDHSRYGDGDTAYWSHPIDIHLATRGLQGWPKFRVEVYRQDYFGRNELISYGFCHVPSSPGSHNFDICTWRPEGNSKKEAIVQYFLGGGRQLGNPELLMSTSDRYQLTTTAMGRVHLQLSVVLRNFDKFGIEC